MLSALLRAGIDVRTDYNPNIFHQKFIVRVRPGGDMALLTGGEAFHDHHHDAPQSALHRPRKGVWNRIVDYNGTVLLLLEKIGWVKDLKIAPRFA